jgi:hypothetical protein
VGCLGPGVRVQVCGCGVSGSCNAGLGVRVSVSGCAGVLFFGSVHVCPFLCGIYLCKYLSIINPLDTDKDSDKSNLRPRWARAAEGVTLCLSLRLRGGGRQGPFAAQRGVFRH